MPKAYSEDLRWRAVWLALVRGMNSYEIGYVLFMSEASVNRYLTLFYTTGAVIPKEHSNGPKKMLGEFEQFTVLQTLIHRQHLTYTKYSTTYLKLLVYRRVQALSVVL